MTPVLHAELSWLAAQGLAHRRDRRLVVLAGLAPDLDGLSLLAGVESYGRWHHVLTHGIVAAVGVTTACALLARRRVATALLAFLVFHLHLACDLAGSGVGWSITYLWPWSRAEWLWSHAWDLDSWQNLIVGIVAVLACFGAALPLGRTITEVVSARWDHAVVGTIRRRFGWRPPDPPPAG